VRSSRPEGRKSFLSGPAGGGRGSGEGGSVSGRRGGRRERGRRDRGSCRGGGRGRRTGGQGLLVRPPSPPRHSPPGAPGGPSLGSGVRRPAHGPRPPPSRPTPASSPARQPARASVPAIGGRGRWCCHSPYHLSRLPTAVDSPPSHPLVVEVEDLLVALAACGGNRGAVEVAPGRRGDGKRDLIAQPRQGALAPPGAPDAPLSRLSTRKPRRGGRCVHPDTTRKGNLGVDLPLGRGRHPRFRRTSGTVRSRTGRKRAMMSEK